MDEVMRRNVEFAKWVMGTYIYYEWKFEDYFLTKDKTDIFKLVN